MVYFNATTNLEKLERLFFGQLQSQTPPRCFPNVKDKSRRFKRNTIDLRFGFAETFGLFCLFAAFDSIPNQMKGVWTCFICIEKSTTESPVIERGCGRGNLENSGWKMHLHRQLTARLIFRSQYFHFLKTSNENLCRHTHYI